MRTENILWITLDNVYYYKELSYEELANSFGCKINYEYLGNCFAVRYEDSEDEIIEYLFENFPVESMIKEIKTYVKIA